MKPRADLTISRFAESRKTIIVVKISLDISEEISSGTPSQGEKGAEGPKIQPLNSKTSLEMAVIVALIIWGVAPARPPAIIVKYSSKDAGATESGWLIWLERCP